MFFLVGSLWATLVSRQLARFLCVCLLVLSHLLGNVVQSISATNLQILHDEILLCQLIFPFDSRPSSLRSGLVGHFRSANNARQTTYCFPFSARNFPANDVVECVSSYQCRTDLGHRCCSSGTFRPPDYCDSLYFSAATTK